MIYSPDRHALLMHKGVIGPWGRHTEADEDPHVSLERAVKGWSGELSRTIGSSSGRVDVVDEH